MCRTDNSVQSFASKTHRWLWAPSTVESCCKLGGLNISGKYLRRTELQAGASAFFACDDVENRRELVLVPGFSSGQGWNKGLTSPLSFAPQAYQSLINFGSPTAP